MSKQNNTQVANCLRTCHEVTTVGQLRKTANCDMPGHVDSQFCNCPKCIEDGIHLGCAHPNNCWKHAMQILHHLHPKWNPDHPLSREALDPPENPSPNLIAEAIKKKSELTFFAYSTACGPYEDSFHIFSLTSPTHPMPVYPIAPSQAIAPNLQQHDLLLISAGYSHINQDGNYENGGRFLLRSSDEHQGSIKMPENMTSPMCGELGALICALQSAPPHLPLKIYIQQKSILLEITINLTRNEDSDWAHTNNKDLYKSLVSNLCQ